MLTNRIEYIDPLAARLRDHGLERLTLRGRLTKTERDAVRSTLAADEGRPLVLIAIDKVAGEGFVVPRLDTLFLTSPV